MVWTGRKNNDQIKNHHHKNQQSSRSSKNSRVLSSWGRLHIRRRTWIWTTLSNSSRETMVLFRQSSNKSWSYHNSGSPTSMPERSHSKSTIYIACNYYSTKWLLRKWAWRHQENAQWFCWSLLDSMLSLRLVSTQLPSRPFHAHKLTASWSPSWCRKYSLSSGQQWLSCLCSVSDWCSLCSVWEP